MFWRIPYVAINFSLNQFVEKWLQPGVTIHWTYWKRSKKLFCYNETVDNAMHSSLYRTPGRSAKHFAFHLPTRVYTIALEQYWIYVFMWL